MNDIVGKEFDPEFRAAQAERAEIKNSKPIRLDLIQPSPTNPRQHFPEDKHLEMVESIRQRGVLQPVMVRPWPVHYPWEGVVMPTYELVIGERRYRGARDAGKFFIPAVVRELTDKEVVEIQLIENIKRLDLDKLEEAEGFDRLMKGHGMSAEAIAQEVGQSKGYVYASLKLLALCEDGRRLYRAGLIDASKALLLARIPVPALQMKAIKEITYPHYDGEPMSARRAKRLIQDRYTLKLDKAPFPRWRDDLTPTAGSCHECPKRTGNRPEGFEDAGSADVCTDPECFAAKKLAHAKKQKEEAAAKGLEVIAGKAAERVTFSSNLENTKAFQRLDEPCYEDPERRTYREILGDQVKPVLVEDIYDHRTLVEALPNTILADKLKEAGLAKRHEEVVEKRAEKAEKLAKEKAYREQVVGAARSQLHADLDEWPSLNITNGRTKAFLQLLTGRVYELVGNDARCQIAAQWQAVGKNAKERAEAFGLAIPAMGGQECLLLLLDMVSLGIKFIPGWMDDWSCPRLLELARIFDIDAEAVRREIDGTGEEQAAEKAPAPPFNIGDLVRVRPDALLYGIKPRSVGKQGSVRQIHVDASDAHVEIDGQIECLMFAELELVSAAAPLQLGDHVRVKGGLKGPNGMLRKCCGQVGVIEAILEKGALCSVKTGPKKNDSVICGLGELEKCPPAPSADTPTPTKAAQAPGVNAPAKKAAQAVGARRAAVYCHPEHPRLTWSGRGRKPLWAEYFLAQAGNTLEMLIPGNPGRAIETNEKPSEDDAPARCDKTLDLPGLAIETNEKPTAAETPAADENTPATPAQE